jgi:uncharacterized protein YraI
MIFHPFYATLSEDQQWAVTSRMMTGSTMPTGSLLGDYVVQQSRPAWGWSDTPTSSSWSSSSATSSWPSTSTSDSGSSAGGEAGIAVVIGFIVVCCVIGGLGPKFQQSSNQASPPAAYHTHNDTTGEAPSRRVITPGASAIASTDQSNVRFVLPPGVNLRSCPTTKCDRITALAPGSKVTITGSAGSGQWLEVDTIDRDGAHVLGYLSARYVAKDKPPLSIAPQTAQPQAPASGPYPRAEPFNPYPTVRAATPFWKCSDDHCWIDDTLYPGMRVHAIGVQAHGWAKIEISGLFGPRVGLVRVEALN